MNTTTFYELNKLIQGLVLAGQPYTPLGFRTLHEDGH